MKKKCPRSGQKSGAFFGFAERENFLKKSENIKCFEEIKTIKKVGYTIKANYGFGKEYKCVNLRLKKMGK